MAPPRDRRPAHSRKNTLRALAACLALCLALLAGCSGAQPQDPVTPDPPPEDPTYVEGYRRGRDPVPFSQMTYVRPDLQELQRAVAEQIDLLAASETLDEAFAAMLAAGRLLDHYDTMYTLSEIHSDADFSDDYWWQEWRFCRDGYAVYLALWDDVCAAIEASDYAAQLLPLWDRALDAPDPENRDIHKSERLGERMDALADEALDIIDTATISYNGHALTLDEAWDHRDWVDATAAWCARYGPELLEIYTQLAAAGGELARDCYGYDDYTSYLFDRHQRDYTPLMALALTEDIVEHLVALDDDIYTGGTWSKLYNEYRDFDSLMQTAAPVLAEMGGEMANALDLMLEYGLYHIDVVDSQYSRPYVIYLATPNVPFLYCPFDGTVSSAADFAHEFGHFYEIYLTMESYCIPDDLSEVHSQAMALLFAQALADETGERVLLEGVLADTVDSLVSQSFNATIELRVFALAPEALTEDAVEQIGRAQSARFGYWQSDPQLARYMWLTDSELYTDPLQPLCYAVSAGVALELWQLSRNDMDLALQKYEALTRHPDSHQFLYNVQAVDLAGPFDPGWAQATEAFLRSQLLSGPGGTWWDAA